MPKNSNKRPKATKSNTQNNQAHNKINNSSNSLQEENNQSTGFLLRNSLPNQSQGTDNRDGVDKIQNAMKNLCKQLSEPNNIFEFDVFITTATSYIAEHKRFLYSVVSDYIVHDLSDDQLHANFFSNIDILANRLDSINDEDTKRAVIRLYDHCMLARMQRNEFLEDDETFKRRAGPIIHDSIESAQRNITEQFVSLIAIFTALAFLIFGGLSSFESIFSHLNETPVCKLLMVASVWGIGLLNLISLFFYFIFRIVKIPFRKTDDSSETTTFQRYPILVIGNFILCNVLIISAALYSRDLIWQCIETITSLINCKEIVPLVGMAIIILAVYVGVLLCIFVRKKK